MKFSNERNTEAIVEKKLNYSNSNYKDNIEFIYQGKTADIFLMNEIKKIPGKPKERDLSSQLIISTNGSYGKPEFIIRNNLFHEFIIVIECKANKSNHFTKEKNKPKDYALDGALYYSNYLKENYNILSIAVSGTNEDNLSVDHYIQYKGQKKINSLNSSFKNIKEVDEYFKWFKDSKEYKEIPREQIRELSFKFHDDLRRLGFTEKQKPLFISNLLLSLKDDNFRETFHKLNTFKELERALKGALSSVLENSKIKNQKLFEDQLFKDLKNNKLQKETDNGSIGIQYFLRELNDKIYHLFDKKLSFDIMGEFYNEFVKYSGGDGKGLGIVLTPYHIAEFFVELLSEKKWMKKDSVLIDIASGTGSFLVAGMKKLFDLSTNDAEKENIKKNQIIGIELNSDMHLISIANMIFNHDGKSNLFQNDSLNLHGNLDSYKTIKKLKPTIGLMNPPYSQKDNESELMFTLKLLEYLEYGGYGITITPLATAIGTKFKPERMELFKKHTLKAVITMPDDLFYPTAATNTCIMIWQAHIPHEVNKKSWFAILKSDGFVKEKKLGRIDKNLEWDSIKRNFYKNWVEEQEIPGISIKKSVDWYDEWLAEAYVGTNYEDLKQDDFIKNIKSFIAFNIKYGDKNE